MHAHTVTYTYLCALSHIHTFMHTVTYTCALCVPWEVIVQLQGGLKLHSLKLQHSEPCSDTCHQGSQRTGHLFYIVVHKTYPGWAGPQMGSGL